MHADRKCSPARTTSHSLLLVVILTSCFTNLFSFCKADDNITLSFSSKSLVLQLDGLTNITLTPSSPLNNNSIIFFNYQIDESIDPTQGTHEVIKPLPNITLLSHSQFVGVQVISNKPGHVTVGINSTSPELVKLGDEFLKVRVVRSHALVIINQVIGWIYFIAWTVSFYPQVIENFRRKSVIGLNFDFLCYNIIGFTAYGLFNVGMFWIPEIKDMFHHQHPRAVNPVQTNDVFFTLHAIVITAITIFQCFIYERGEQRVSKVCMVLVGGSLLFAAITLFVAIGKAITWLDYVYYFSYIKLGVSIIKYVPQAYMNFRRKSTDGWSIGNVLLDFTGGSFSLLQMFLISYNNDDFSSVFTDPTKFGLGFFSILFDLLFIVQHYCLYRNAKPPGFEPVQSVIVKDNSLPPYTDYMEDEPLIDPGSETNKAY